MANAVVPQLCLTAPVAENNSDKMVALLKFLMFNPGWISSWNDEKLLSMRKSMAQYTEDKSKLVPALSQMLNEAVQHFYPSYRCEVSVIDEDDPNVYSIDIAIKDSLNNLVIQLERIKKDESGLFIIR
jgi:hypothetical protein